jgi:hypothetical protein
MWATSVIFQKLAKVNNPPNGRKFAQSGHPGGQQEFFFYFEAFPTAECSRADFLLARCLKFFNIGCSHSSWLCIVNIRRVIDTYIFVNLQKQCFCEFPHFSGNI